MSPRHASPEPIAQGFPRVSGDEPTMGGFLNGLGKLSPREQG